MKLLFPNGEHAPVELAVGKTLLGSTSEAGVVLLAPGVAPRHAEIQYDGMTGKVTPCHPDNAVAVNGKPVTGPADLKPGDQVSFAQVRARAVAVEKQQSTPLRQREPEVADDGRTKVRVALPKFVLRGVSGVTFGKVFPIQATTVIGRQADCEVSVPSEEVSRRHAELRVTVDGVMVEDLGSANGTFINDRRITRQILRPGDELRLDTIRFLLLAPGQEMAAARPDPASAGQAAAGNTVGGPSGPRTALMWAMVASAVVVVAALAAKLAGWY